MDYETRFRQAQRPKYDCLLFDLDDTLYPRSNGVGNACDQNVKDFLVEKLGIERSTVDELGFLLYKNYGTTLAGLRAIGYDFDYDEYHSFVQGRLPYENLKLDPVLRNLLLSLPYRKLIFTNADKIHAVKALSRLGLEDCFEGIICFETLNPTNKSTVSDDDDDDADDETVHIGSSSSNDCSATSSEIFDIIDHFAQSNPTTELPKTPVICKPSEFAIELALKIASLDPQRTGGLRTSASFTNTLFFEDSVRNIQAGKRVGLHTVRVGTSQRVQGADYALESIHNLREAVPELWDSEIKSDVAYPSKLTVETSVTA